MLPLRSSHRQAFAGIGKSLFLYYLMWKLAREGKKVVWDRLHSTPVMFSKPGVFEGPLEAFYGDLKDPETWWVPPPAEA